jgi:Domain of unknown function (DUF6487)
MKCPECSTEMTAGTTKVTWSTLGGIAEVAGALLSGGTGGSQQYLYFYPADGGECVCVFERTRKALRCPRCHAVVILGQGMPSQRS